MHRILQHLSLPWTLALLALLIGVLALAFLRALRRRRATVPGLTVFLRAKTQNLPPAPPPRFLDRTFFLKAALLTLLILIVGGLAVQSNAGHERRIAILLDDGPAGEYALVGADGKPAGHLKDRLIAEADRLAAELKSAADAEVSVIRASSTGAGRSNAASSASTDLMQALERLRVPGSGAGAEEAGSGTSAASQAKTSPRPAAGVWDEIHIVSGRLAPAAEAGNWQSSATKIVWHTPAFQPQSNAGIVRIWVEPAPAPAPAADAAPVEGQDANAAPVAGAASRIAVYVDFIRASTDAKSFGPSLDLLEWSYSRDGRQWDGTQSRQFAHLNLPENRAREVILGPLIIDTFVEGQSAHFLRIQAGAPSLPTTPAVPAPVDGFPADDEVILTRAPAAPLSAIIDPTVDLPMVTGALAAWQIHVVTPESLSANLETLGAPGPHLFICDGSPEALARLEKLRAPAGGNGAPAIATAANSRVPILPVFLAPPGDLPGLSFEITPPARVDETSVPAASPEYALLGRQSWQVDALRTAKPYFSGTVVVQSKIGPAIVRLIDAEGHPTWAILFDPAHSTLANRNAAAWLALWDLIAADARHLAGDNANTAAGWTWPPVSAAATANTPQNTNPLDRELTALASSAGKITVLSPGATAAEPNASSTDVSPNPNARAATFTTWSFAAVAAVFGLFLLYSLAGATPPVEKPQSP